MRLKNLIHVSISVQTFGQGDSVQCANQVSRGKAAQFFGFTTSAEHGCFFSVDAVEHDGWVSVFDALPDWAKSGRRQFSAELVEVRDEMEVVAGAGVEYVGGLEGFTAFNSGSRQLSDFLTGQGVQGFDLHLSRLLVSFRSASHSVDMREKLPDRFDAGVFRFTFTNLPKSREWDC